MLAKSKYVDRKIEVKVKAINEMSSCQIPVNPIDFLVVRCHLIPV